MNAVRLLAGFGGEGVNDADALQRVKAELKAVGPFPAGGIEVNRITHDAEIAALKGEVVAVILHGDEVDDEVLLAELE